MPLSKKRNRDRMELAQVDYRVKVGECSACHRIAPIHRHHLSYKTDDVVMVCASCHKKIHLYMEGKQRTTSNPYINPLVKLVRDNGTEG